jgi:hypothetical protein
MEIPIPKEKVQQLAELMDSEKFTVYTWMLEQMIDRIHGQLETAKPEESPLLQGECKRLRRLLMFREFLLKAAQSNGVAQASD